MANDVTQAFERRLAIYRTKQEQADPFGEDVYSRHEALRYVIEAVELLAVEAGVALSAALEQPHPVDEKEGI